MTNYDEAKKAHEFKFIEPLDESLILALNAEPDTPKDKMVYLIKEHLCRRGRKCSLCGKSYNRRNLIIDRRKPVSHGGRDNIENLQLLCHKCSALKGGSTMLQIRKKLRAQKPNIKKRG
ncbi:MAG: HNH endonuclease signature motif containing protein [Candidatus Altiarchaeota archaeon]